MTTVFRLLSIFLLSGTAAVAQSILLPWSGHGHDPQHSGLSQVASQPMQGIRWQAPIDLNPQYNGGVLYVHYGSPVITRQNTVIIPVKTGASDGFRVEARQGSDGALKWKLDTGYTLPVHNWVPQYSMALTPKNRLCYPSAGGTVAYVNDPDTLSQPAVADGRLVFYGLANYQASSATLDANVKINTAITSDRYGNLFFGFVVENAVTLPGNVALRSGIARIAEDGTGSWIAADTAAGDNAMIKVATNQSLALSNDHKTLYVAVASANSTGYLLSLDSRTLATTGKIRLRDLLNPLSDARIMDDGTASPMVGPDGDVYFGVFENAWGANHYRGWLLHFDKSLTQTKTCGAFGWDQTPSVVPASLVSSYHGSSEYLLLSKYNNYAPIGGDGVNKVAILDPNDTMVDPISGATVMKEILTIAGVTPDEPYVSNQPNAVKEWCVNSVAVDTFTRSAILNSEDGKVYRWDFATNTLIQPVTLTSGLGQAYTPTVIGVDGTVYAIGNAILFAVGSTTP